MRIVLDTNVLVAGLLNPRGNPASILNAVLDENVAVLVDDRILDEYRDVLQRPRFGFSSDTVNALLDFFEHHGEYVAAGPASGAVSDPDDAPFYDVAIAGGAQYLVTGNAKHFPGGDRIVSPGEFTKAIRDIL
jgi:putative PIN family toxin of toxin-antitoxin system